MQVGTTKDQGLYNKPSAAVHPGAFAAGTLPQYSTIQSTQLKEKVKEKFRTAAMVFYILPKSDAHSHKMFGP